MADPGDVELGEAFGKRLNERASYNKDGDEAHCVPFECVDASIRVFIENAMVEEYVRPFQTLKTFRLTDSQIESFKDDIRKRVRVECSAVLEAHVSSEGEVATVGRLLASLCPL